MQTGTWQDTGRRGDYGKIYRNRQTGELAEEHDNTYLVAVNTIPEELPVRFNGHSYLIEQDRIARGLPV
jgi:hypothetical protein